MVLNGHHHFCTAVVVDSQKAHIHRAGNAAWVKRNYHLHFSRWQRIKNGCHQYRQPSYVLTNPFWKTFLVLQRAMVSRHDFWISLMTNEFLSMQTSCITSLTTALPLPSHFCCISLPHPGTNMGVAEWLVLNKRTQQPVATWWLSGWLDSWSSLDPGF